MYHNVICTIQGKKSSGTKSELLELAIFFRHAPTVDHRNKLVQEEFDVLEEKRKIFNADVQWKRFPES